MKYKKTMLVALVLLAILTMSAVSASDSANENLTVSEDLNVESSAEDNPTASKDLNVESSADEIELASDNESAGTFSELVELINSHEGSVLELERNYQQDDMFQASRFNDMDIVIDGKGHNLTCTDDEFWTSEGIFKFDMCDVTLKNINLYNSSNVAFNFFFGKVSIINCTFHGCGDSALYYEGGTSDSGFKVINSSFYDCTDKVIYSDVNYVDLKLTSYISGCKFINCSSLYRGLIWCYRPGISWSLENCYFYNCTAYDEEFGIIDGGFLKKLDNCSFIHCSPIIYSLDNSIFAPNIVEGDVENIVFSFSANVNGTATVTIDDEKDYPVNVTNGCGELNVTGLSFGEHSVSVNLNDMDYFGNNNATSTFGVFYDPNLEITTDGCIDGKITFNIKLNENITDDLFFSVSQSFWDIDYMGNYLELFDEFYTADVHVVNGVGSITISNLKSGEYNATIKYEGAEEYGYGDDDYYMSSKKRIPFNFISSKSTAPKITAKDLTMQYSAGNKYSVTVYGTNGKVAANKWVVFKVKGKQVAKVRTNAKGVATYKPTQVPGNYKISATALGKTVTKTLKVKQVLTLKAVKVKKSAKKLVLTATLAKVNKKYLKGKKITFKFNGKKIKTVKTNKKGVAKVTIEKALLKKLKVGKKVTYQATYLKDTVKKTTKVKK